MSAITAKAGPPEGTATRSSGANDGSYGQILKSSALIGSASVANLAIGLVRTKCLAVLLGPAGMGLFGLYGSIADLAQSIAGLGLVGSGVRQIAEAAGSADSRRIALTATVLRRVSLLLGILGGLLLAAVALPVSVLSFGGAEHAGAIALLGLAVGLKVVSDGQAALLQGLRRIADIARLAVLGGALGAAAGIGWAVVRGEDGIVPGLVSSAALTLFLSWRLSRGLVPPGPAPAAGVWLVEASALVKLGLAFMASGLFTLGAAYGIRLLVIRQAGIEAAGLYQAAWTLGGLYVGVILQAMGADFYPRLAAVAQDDSQCRRLVNEQAQVSLLLALPGVLVTLSLAPWVLGILYAPEFQGAVDVLRWLCLGMTLRILSWPLGYIVVAKGAQGYFFGSELAWTLVYLSAGQILVERYGMDGAGMAFVLSYAFHVLLSYALARRLSDFRWSPGVRRNGLLALGLTGLAYAGVRLLPAGPALVLGLGLAGLAAIHSVRSVLNLVGTEAVPPPLCKLLRRAGFRRISSGPSATLRRPRAVATSSHGSGGLRPAFGVLLLAAVWTFWLDGRYGCEPAAGQFALDAAALLEETRARWPDLAAQWPRWTP